jgi:hypothetical protein
MTLSTGRGRVNRFFCVFPDGRLVVGQHGQEQADEARNADGGEHGRFPVGVIGPRPP